MAIALWLLLLWSGSPVPQWQVPLDTSGETGALVVALVDVYGHPVEGGTITVEPVANGKSGARSPFKSGTELEYGTYRLRVLCPRFNPAVQTIEISSPSRLVVVSLGEDEAEWRALYTIRGRVAHWDLYSACQIVHLAPLVSQEGGADARVLGGEFVLENVRPGRYAAVLLGPKGICTATQVTIYLYHKTEIVIGDHDEPPVGPRITTIHP